MTVCLFREHKQAREACSFAPILLWSSEKKSLWDICSETFVQKHILFFSYFDIKNFLVSRNSSVRDKSKSVLVYFLKVIKFGTLRQKGLLLDMNFFYEISAQDKTSFVCFFEKAYLMFCSFLSFITELHNYSIQSFHDWEELHHSDNKFMKHRKTSLEYRKKGETETEQAIPIIASTNSVTSVGTDTKRKGCLQQLCGCVVFGLHVVQYSLTR